MAILTFTNVSITLITLYLARRGYWEATTGSRRRALAKQKQALPSPAVGGQILGFIPTLGLDIAIEIYRAWKQSRILECWEHDLRDNNAHTVSFTILGSSIWLTDDPENIKCMLATNFNDWSLGQERIEQFSNYLGHGIFTNEGKAWKVSREMLRPCFEKSQVADVSLFDKHVGKFTSLLPCDGTMVDLQPLFHELTLDAATEFLFGVSTNSLDRGDNSQALIDFAESFDYCGDDSLNENYKKYGYLGLFLPDKKRKRCAKYVQDFADEIIDEEISSKKNHLAQKQTRYVFLDELMIATSDRTTIRSELLNILLAGRDTTAALLSNVLWELSRQPEVLGRLRHEITDIIGDDIPTYEQLKEMKYLKAILNESQRLYPIVPSNSREAIVDTFLPRGGGPDGQSPVLIPKGSYVLYSMWAMHRRTDIYGKDAAEFRPERWLESSLRPGWSYIPFSGGPRVCIGQNFALTEAMFVVVRLLQVFEIESRDAGVWREKLSITCRGLGGCKVALKRREV